MKLTPPKKIVWIIALAAAAVGLVAWIVMLAGGPAALGLVAFILAIASAALMLVSTALKGI